MAAPHFPEEGTSREVGRCPRMDRHQAEQHIDHWIKGRFHFWER